MPRQLFQPGQSGNPAGRPKRGAAMADALRKVLDQKDENGVQNKHLVAQTIIEAAIKGQQWAINFIFDRLDGKLPEDVAAGEGGGIVVRTVTAILPPQRTDAIDSD